MIASFVLAQQRKIHLIKMNIRRIELDITKEIAKIAKLNSVNSFIFVSALYANPKSSGDYVRFKGLVEEELKRT